MQNLLVMMEGLPYSADVKQQEQVVGKKPVVFHFSSNDDRPLRKAAEETWSPWSVEAFFSRCVTQRMAKIPLWMKLPTLEVCPFHRAIMISRWLETHGANSNGSSSSSSSSSAGQQHQGPEEDGWPAEEDDNLPGNPFCDDVGFDDGGTQPGSLSPPPKRPRQMTTMNG